MKRQVAISVISLIVFALLPLSDEGMAHQKGGMMGQRRGPMMGGGMMKGGGMGDSGVGLRGILHQWIRLLLGQKDQLGLTDEQLDNIQRLINLHMKTAPGRA